MHRPMEDRLTPNRKIVNIDEHPIKYTDGYGRLSDIEAGDIFWLDGVKYIAVSNATLEKINKQKPISNQIPAAPKNLYKEFYQKKMRPRR